MNRIHQMSLNTTGKESPVSSQLSCQSLRDAVEHFEKDYISDTLTLNKGRRGKTASILGIDRKTLYMKMKKYNLY